MDFLYNIHVEYVCMSLYHVHTCILLCDMSGDVAHVNNGSIPTGGGDAATKIWTTKVAHDVTAAKQPPPAKAWGKLLGNNANKSPKAAPKFDIPLDSLHVSTDNNNASMTSSATRTKASAWNKLMGQQQQTIKEEEETATARCPMTSVVNEDMTVLSQDGMLASARDNNAPLTARDVNVSLREASGALSPTEQQLVASLYDIKIEIKDEMDNLKYRMTKIDNRINSILRIFTPQSSPHASHAASGASSRTASHSSAPSATNSCNSSVSSHTSPKSTSTTSQKSERKSSGADGGGSTKAARRTDSKKSTNTKSVKVKARSEPSAQNQSSGDSSELSSMQNATQPAVSGGSDAAGSGSVDANRDSPSRTDTPPSRTSSASSRKSSARIRRSKKIAPHDDGGDVSADSSSTGDVKALSPIQLDEDQNVPVKDRDLDIL